MKIGQRHGHPGLRWSESSQKLLLVFQYEVHLEEHEMTQLGKDLATATNALKFLLDERTKDKATIQQLQTQLASAIPTDDDTNKALADFSTEVAAIPADVTTPAAPTT